MKKSSGFTLIEILIALTIFAILTSITVSVVYNAFETRKRLVLQSNTLNTLVLATSLLKQDTENAVNRSVWGDGMQIINAFVGQPDYMEFTRDGLLNQDIYSQQSTLLRVAYLCRQHQLIRRFWDRTDTPLRQQYHEQILLANLSQCAFAYVNQHKHKVPEWQITAHSDSHDNQEVIPRGIELSLSGLSYDKVQLLFVLPGALYGQ